MQLDICKEQYYGERNLFQLMDIIFYSHIIYNAIVDATIMTDARFKSTNCEQMAQATDEPEAHATQFKRCPLGSMMYC
jgi:hypothetical protein